uniref:Uncharacterized protein n=1 Tax=Anguilla anguilla TaxID=7936 RepID=A0A0E9Y0H0_ANGAN
MACYLLNRTVKNIRLVSGTEIFSHRLPSINGKSPSRRLN